MSVSLSYASLGGCEVLLYTQVLVNSDTALKLQIGVLRIGRFTSPLDSRKITWSPFLMLAHLWTVQEHTCRFKQSSKHGLN